MSNELKDHFPEAQEQARANEIEIDGVKLGAFPTEEFALTKYHKEKLIEILKKWNIGTTGDDFSEVLKKFQQKYNMDLERKIREDGKWNLQVRFAMEVYSVSLKAFQDSKKSRKSLADNMEQGSQKNSNEKSAFDIKKDYDAIKEVLKQSQDPNGILAFEYITKAGKNVNIGRFNTRTDGGITEEYENIVESVETITEDGKIYEENKTIIENGLLGVVKDMGFKGFLDFAQAFNKKFSHRDDITQKQVLIGSAESVSERFGSENIHRTDEDFRNLRYAIQIWAAYERMPKNRNDTVTFGPNYSFKLSDLQKVFPGLTREEAIISNETEAKFIKALLQLAPDGKVPHFSSIFIKYEKMSKNQSENDLIISKEDQPKLMAELAKFEEVYGMLISTSADYLSGVFIKKLSGGFYEEAARMRRFTSDLGVGNFDNEDSLYNFRERFCEEHGRNEDWCYDGG